MNSLKTQLYSIPSIYYIALQVATLVSQNKVDELKGVIWTVNRIINNCPSFENDILAILLEIRKETMMDDGNVDYTRYQTQLTPLRV